MIAAARCSALACLSLMLTACGGAPAPDDSAEEAVDESEAAALGRDTDETVLDDMIQTQDRARGVEDLTLGRKGELEQALDASSGDAAAAAEEE